MTAPDRNIEREALSWLVRVNDPAFGEWDAFDRWMTADARHQTVYWGLAEAEADAVEALKAPAPPDAVRSIVPWPLVRPRVRRRVLAIAAAVVAAVGVGWIGWNQIPRPWTVETAPGEPRTIILADGSRVSLDGGTQLAFDRRRPRDARLDAGRALFEVVHDEDRPFTVEVGETTLTDLGTTFDVTRLQDGVRVSVSEGVVRVDAETGSAILNPGDSVLATDRGLERRTLAPQDMTSWREGRLVYADETLGVIAQDLSRALDLPVAVAPALADRRFSGSLATGSPQDRRRRLEAVLGVSIRDQGEGWRLEPRPAP